MHTYMHACMHAYIILIIRQRERERERERERDARRKTDAPLVSLVCVGECPCYVCVCWLVCMWCALV